MPSSWLLVASLAMQQAEAQPDSTDPAGSIEQPQPADADPPPFDPDGLPHFPHPLTTAGWTVLVGSVAAGVVIGAAAEGEEGQSAGFAVGFFGTVGAHVLIANGGLLQSFKLSRAGVHSTRIPAWVADGAFAGAGVALAASAGTEDLTGFFTGMMLLPVGMIAAHVQGVVNVSAAMKIRRIAILPTLSDDQVGLSLAGRL